jgi:hypothetical protein
MSATTMRHVVATVVVAVSLFYFLYGPPLTERLTQAAHSQCNRMIDASYRNYQLEWRTATFTSVDRPHWVCHDLTRPGAPGRSLGWWVGL